MAKDPLEAYGEMAKELNDYTQISGRHPVLKEKERRILFDIVQKLDITPTDSILDIGCGTGNLTIPLSFFVEQVVGIDHPKVVKELRTRNPGNDKIKLIGGDFLYTEINGKFDKIFANSVIQLLANRQEAKNFINRAFDLLTHDGKLLIGDIKNVDKRERFLNSPFGERFHREWQEWKESSGIETKESRFLDDTADTVTITDDFLMSIILDYRGRGYESYLLPQDTNLPFGFAREDLLIAKPTKSDPGEVNSLI